jgi:hypothetical protein
MPDQVDFDLRSSGAPVEPIESFEPTPNRPTAAMVAIGLFVVAVGFAVYLVFGRQTSAPVNEQPSAAAAAATEKPATPLGGAGEAIVVPPLEESDPLVRELVTKLSSHPNVAAWLTTDGLIRNFAVVVANISEGRTPSTHLKSVTPAGPFRTVDHKGDLLIDARSYQRYDRLADAVASVDAAGSARLYATLKPRIEEANRELGHADGSFDRMLEKAIISLLAVPAVPAAVEVGPRGIVYGYEDPALEMLTPAQKHLLRMGPRNVRLIQDKLREIAQSLGIPAERLPAPR